MLVKDVSRCPVCATEVNNEPKRCPRCKVLYHESCWNYWGDCAVYGCTSSTKQFSDRSIDLRARNNPPNAQRPSRRSSETALFLLIGIMTAYFSFIWYCWRGVSSNLYSSHESHSSDSSDDELELKGVISLPHDDNVHRLKEYDYTDSKTGREYRVDESELRDANGKLYKAIQLKFHPRSETPDFKISDD